MSAEVLPLFQAHTAEYCIFLHAIQYSKGLRQGHRNIPGHHLTGQLIAQELCKKLAGSQSDQSTAARTQ